MDLKLILGTASAIILILGFIPYIIDTLKRKTKPHAYTWLVFSIQNAIVAAAQHKSGAGFGTYMLMAGTVLCFLVFLLSFRFGTKNIKKIDNFCLLFSLLTIMVYLKISNPLWAVILVSLVDFVGFVPTLRKAFEEPSTETVVTYSLGMISSVLSLLALQTYSVTNALFACTLLLSDLLIVFIILTRRKNIKLMGAVHDNRC